MHRRTIVRWLHDLEDADRADALADGESLLGAAVGDRLIAEGEREELAGTLIALDAEGMIAFDCFFKQIHQFGEAPLRDIEGAEAFRSTSKGRAWLASERATFEISGSQVGQIAGRDLTNVTITTVLERAEAELACMDVPDEQRDEARGILRALRDGARDTSTGTAAGIAAAALAKAFGLA